MRNIQKHLSLLLALVMAFGLSVGATAAYTDEDYAAAAKTVAVSALAEDYSGKTVILHSNDVHGQIDGYAYMAALRTLFEGKGAEVIVADAGDFSQGTPYVSTSKGASAVTMMNAAKYDIVTLGNHEFDFGYDQLMENLSAAEFKTISADVLKDGETILDPTLVYETKSGLKIGFFGLETPETATKVNPGLIKGVSFLSNAAGATELNDCAKLQVENLKKDGADLIVGLWHLGVDDESKADGHRSLDVLGKLEGVDIVLDGHSHTVMTAGENGEAIQSTGTKFMNVGAVVINDSTKKIEDHYLINVSDGAGTFVDAITPDADVAAKAKEIMDAVDKEYDKVFAVTAVELNGERDPGNRTEETNLGDLITDALIWSAKSGISQVDADHIVAITNGGGIRATVKAGDMTKKNINEVLPFGNTVAVIYATGEQLLEALEASTYSTPKAIGAFPQTAGIKWSVDCAKQYDQGELYVVDGKASTYYAPKSVNRVTIESINGKAFDKAAMYAVVTTNFVTSGGDTYAVLHKAYSRSDEYRGFDTGIPMDEALMDYITEELKGTVTAAAYGEPAGRLTVIPDPIGKYTDVDASLWYAAALRYVTEQKMMGGNGLETTFDPDGAVTRGMVMTILARMEGEDTTPGEGQQWYDKGVLWAQLKGISDGTRVTDAVTREEFATMLYRYVKEVKGEGFTGEWMFLLENPDASSVSDWADEAVHWAVMNKVIKGMDDAGNIVPQGGATRAQVAQMFLNYANIVKD